MNIFKLFSDWLKSFFGNGAQELKRVRSRQRKEVRSRQRKEVRSRQRKEVRSRQRKEVRSRQRKEVRSRQRKEIRSRQRKEIRSRQRKEIRSRQRREVRVRQRKKQTPPVDNDGADQNENRQEEKAQEAQQKAVETGKNRKSRENVSQSRNIGGRRVTSLEPRKPSDKERKQTEYAPAAELVCRERGREWELALSVPDERAAASVQQNGETLPGVDGDYPLSRYDGYVTVTYEDGKKETLELCSDRSPLFFKMSRNWSGTGKLVSNISRGYLIAVAPSSWTRKGNPPVNPENCVVDGHRAHFFYVETTDDTAAFEEWTAHITGGIRLEGEKIVDDSEDGDLFIGSKPPTLEADENIVWFRVGPEGGAAPDGWKGTNFEPDEKTLSDIMNGREGWFFVRAFVAGSRRAADVDHFRYCKDLRKIRVNGERYTGDALITPGGGGHIPAKLEFIGKESERIRPQLKGGNGYAQVQADGSALIDPDKRGDETVWILGKGANEVEIGIHLPRVWWKLDGGDWTDKPFSMTHQEFYKKRKSKLTVSLPHFVKDVHAGFDLRMSQKMQTLKEKEKDRPRASKRVETPFSLLSFAEYNEIDKPLSADAFLQIRCSDCVINLVRVTKDKPEKKLDKPDICAQHKIRRNDGFSRREVLGADLSIDAARRMGCRVDRRRKSCHQHNIDFLKQKKRERDASSE